MPFTEIMQSSIMRTVLRSSMSNLLLCVLGLAVASLCFVTFFLRLQSDATRSEDGGPLHHHFHSSFDAAIHYSRKSHFLENRTFPTVSSTKSSDEPMTVVREGRTSLVILNETAKGKVSSTETMSHSPTLWSVPETCEEPNCAEFLSQEEKLAILQCRNKVVKKLPGYEVQRSLCKFLPGVERPRVMLVSAEGSGNTWLRGLLEKATGVCTGFCCCDAAMRARGFIGEGVKSGNVLVVKTHDTALKKGGKSASLYGSAVFLLRNPAHSLIADRNRRVTNVEENRKGIPHNDSHTNIVSEDLFVSEGWNRFIKQYLHMWELRLTNWVLNHDRPVHVVRYEDLQNDKVKEVEKILDFLHFSYDHDDIVAALEEDYSVFQRSHKHDHFQHYSARQKQYLRTTLLRMLKSASQRGKAHLLHLDEYLESIPDID